MYSSSPSSFKSRPAALQEDPPPSQKAAPLRATPCGTLRQAEGGLAPAGCAARLAFRNEGAMSGEFEAPGLRFSNVFTGPRRSFTRDAFQQLRLCEGFLDVPGSP
eukprot:2502168-Pyramimonas_sp.AAC.1